MRTTKKQAFLWAAVLGLGACGKLPSDSEEAQKNTDELGVSDDEVVAYEAPEDSTGSTGAVRINVGSPDAAALALADEAPAEAPKVVKVGSLTIKTARISIASIKLKAKKDPTQKEEQNDEKEMQEDADAAQAADAAETPAAALSDGEEDGKRPEGEAPEVTASSETEDGQPAADGEEEDGKRERERHDKVAKHRDELEQKEKKQCDREEKRDRHLKLKGPFVLDAINGKFEGDNPPQFDLGDGTYRRVEFKAKRNFKVADTDPLLGNTLYWEGEVETAAATADAPAKTAKVVFESHYAMNFRLKGDKAFAVLAGSDNELLVVFDVAKWVDGVDLSKAKADADGTILISNKSNRDLYQQIKHNIKAATRFGKDADGDKKLKTDEAAGEGDTTAPDAD